MAGATSALLLALLLAAPLATSARVPPSTRPNLELTQEELTWIREHPVINVRVSRNFPPFEFYADDRFQGLAYDYLDLIAQRTGLTFVPTPEMPWTEALHRIKNRDGVDMLLLVTHTEARESFLNFTRDYIVFPEVIFSRKDSFFVSGLSDLDGHVVATENGFVTTDLLRQYIRNVVLLETKTTLEALRAVATGQADAYVGNLAVGTYLLQKHGLVDLKIAAPTEYGDDRMAMGVRKDWPQLASILDKVLASVTTEDQHALKNRWFQVRYEHGLKVTDVAIWVLLVILVALVAILLMRRRAERKLRASETRLRAIVEDQTEFIVRWLPDGTRTFVNDSYCKCFGQSREDLVGTSFFPLISAEQRAEVQRRMASITPEAPVITGEHKVLLPDGSTGWQAWTDRALFNDRGELIEYQSVGRDITARKLAEQRLEENEAYFRSVFQTSPDTIALVRSSDGALLDVNDNGLAQFGYRREELDATTSTVQLGLWDDPSKRERFLQTLQQSGKVDNLEASFRKRDGQTFPALVSARPMMYRGDACHLAFIKDITAIQAANQALQESEANYRRLSQEFAAVLDGIVDSLVLLDADLKVVWGNRGAARQFGLTQQELVGRTCHQLWTGDTGEPCADCVRNVFQTAQPFETVRISGDQRTWGVKGYPVFDNAGRVINVIQIASDLTEKLQLREEATRATHLAALGSLSAGIAHEINNPTGLVLMALPFVRDGMRDLLAVTDDYVREHGDLNVAGLPYATFREEVLQTLDDIQGGGQRIRRIVEDLKDFAREKSDQDDERVDLNTMIDRSLRLLQNVVKNSTDHFILEIEDDLPQVKGSSQRLEQVLVNLVQNACQALSSKDAAITLRARRDAQGQGIVLQVIDQGCGIPPDLIEKITDPFFTTRRESGGTGLGLSVSTRIIEEHGGTLQIASQPGQGSTFTIVLPTADGEST